MRRYYRFNSTKETDKCNKHKDYEHDITVVR